MLEFFFFLQIRRLPRSTLFPYTTLFRSAGTIKLTLACFQTLPLEPSALQSTITLSTVASTSLAPWPHPVRSEEHTSELQSRFDIVCRLLLEKKKHTNIEKKLRADIHLL